MLLPEQYSSKVKLAMKWYSVINKRGEAVSYLFSAEDIATGRAIGKQQT